MRSAWLVAFALAASAAAEASDPDVRRRGPEAARVGGARAEAQDTRRAAELARGSKALEAQRENEGRQLVEKLRIAREAWAANRAPSGSSCAQWLRAVFTKVGF
jgi:hypothetical protein